MMRTAAIERLRKEYGVSLTKHQRSPTAIASAIFKVEPRLSSRDPMVVIRAWLGLRSEDAVKPPKFLATGREYRPDSAMRAVMQRCQGLPKPVPLVSNVPLTGMDWR